MTQQPIKIGFIGSGAAGERSIRNFIKQDGVEVVAIAEPRPQRRAEIAEKYAIETTFEDYHDLIALDEIDAVGIATPNFLHAPTAIAALNAGKHVLTEKPFALSAAEGEKMVKAAEQNDRILKVIYNQRRYQDVLTLKQYIDEGCLGRIYHAKANWQRRKGIPGMGSWFTQKAMSGGGPMIDLGVHVLDMALHLMGEPTPVSVTAATYAEQGPKGKGGAVVEKFGVTDELLYDVEDLATAFIRMDDGATLLLEASWAVYGKRPDDMNVVLYGTDGGAEVEIVKYNRENTVTIYNDVGGVPALTKPEVRGGDGPLAVVEEFIAIIRSGDYATHRGYEGLTRARILDAVYRSAAEGAEVRIATS